LNPYVLVGFAALAYVFAVDDNVAPYLLLQIKRLQLLAGRAIWIARYHPGTPWARYAINRRAWRLAEELRKSFSSKEPEVG